MATHTDPTPLSPVHGRTHRTGADDAFLLLRTVFTIAPIAFGLDKFAQILCDWDFYLAPWINDLVPGDAHDAMLVVGVIEIVAGLLVAVRPSIGGYVVALWLAAHDRRVPWHAKAVAFAVAAYALSPIDLIPDFIPVLGLLDDLVIVPLGIFLALKLVPAALIKELRREALLATRPRPVAGLVFVAAVWILAAFAAWRWWRG